MTNVKSLLALYLKMGGSLTDTYSDIAGGIPVGQYSLISDAVLACSKKYSSGGGGAEKFVVTLTEENDTWTSDKTLAEIVAANAAGKIVVGSVIEDGETPAYELPLSFAGVDAGDGAAVFNGIYAQTSDLYAVSAYYFVFGGETSIGIFKQLIPSSGSSNAPLIVTMTAGETEGQFVGDKTLGEITAAISAGKNVVLNIEPISGVSISAAVLHCLTTSEGGETAVQCYWFNGNSIVHFEGLPNEFVVLDLS